MPAEAGVYGLQQPVKLNTPFENLSQVLQVRQQQQQIQSNRALEQERRAKLAEDAQKRKEEDAYYQILSGPGTTDDRLEAIRSNPLTAKFYAPTLKSKQDAYKSAADTQEAIGKAAEAQANAIEKTQAHQAGQAQKVIASGYNPAMFTAIAQHELELFPQNKEVASALAQVQATAPEQQPALIKQLMEGWGHSTPASSNAMNAQAPPRTVQPGEGVRNAAGGYDVPVPKEATPEARAQQLLKKQIMKQPMTADEQGELASYQALKLLGPEAAAANAANQQARAIAASMAQQQRSQSFTEQQAGRKELQEKVEAPFLTAQSSAQTLRDTVSAAKGGNMTAANLQALETTMAAIRAQGLNRVNTAEIGMAQGAGSAWDRLQGWFGRATAGQPVDPKIQNDMIAMADILEKGAAQKYMQGWQATTKRYGLSDERPLVQGAPTAGVTPIAAAPPAQTSGALHKVGDTVLGPDGKPHKVLEVSPDGKRYRLDGA